MADAARLDTLALIEAACWNQLRAAANKTKQEAAHEWRTMTLATLDGDRPAARTVVLRDVDATARELMFFSDSRSPKVAQLHAQPRATLLLWSERLGWQLRLQVNCTLHVDGLVATSRWARLKLSPAAHDYLSPLAPGAPMEGWQIERGSREYFAVVVAKVLEIDWLELHAQGHRRARLCLSDGATGPANGSTWLAP